PHDEAARRIHPLALQAENETPACLRSIIQSGKVAKWQGGKVSRPAASTTLPLCHSATLPLLLLLNHRPTSPATRTRSPTPHPPSPPTPRCHPRSPPRHRGPPSTGRSTPRGCRPRPRTPTRARTGPAASER